VKAVALALLFVSGQSEPQGLPQAQIQAVETAVDAFMAERKVPGLTVAVATEGRLRWTRGFGLADVENGVPATADTMYRLASISKPITATAVMQLVERGRLDLDAPVRRYVPSFPEKQWPITSRQLLAHLGGIRSYLPGEVFDVQRHYNSALEGLEIFEEDPLVHEPGTTYLYSTYGYTLLGAVVEAVSGRGFMEYLRENVFRPAGMESTRDDDARVLIPHRAQGYVRIANGELRNSAMSDTSYKVPGGGLIGTAADVARFVGALASGTLVQKETLGVMLTKQRSRSGRVLGYGLGWTLSEWKGRREVYHTGSKERVHDVLYWEPDRGVAIAILTNLEHSEPTDLARRLALLLAP